MPTEYTFPLEPEAVDELPRYPGRALHAICYDWLARGDDDLAAQLHTTSGTAPFTVALLPAWRDHPPHLRVTLLDDGLRAAFETGLAQTPEITVLDQPVALPTAGPDVQRTSYASVDTSAGTARRVRLRFITPTSFRSGEMHQPLPVPVSCYQSWLRRWNTFAPEELRINVAVLDLVEEHVAVARYRLQTEMARLGGPRRMVGFVGAVDYVILRAGKIGATWQHAINVLADYAPYCGTGHRTSQGMGQTRRLPSRKG